MKTPPPFSAALLCFIIASAAVADDKILLRPHFEPGKVYVQESVTDINMMVPGLGDNGGQKTNIAQLLTVTVTKDPASDNKMAEVKFTGIKGTVSMMGQTMSYDSSDPAKASPFLQQTFGTLVGKSFTLVYDKDDKYLDAKGLGKVAATPLGQGKGMSDKDLAETFRKSQEMSLPSNPVAVGDTWNYEDTLDMPPVGKITIKATGKFDSISAVDGRQQAKVTLAGKFESPAGGAAQLVQFSEGSAFTGTVYFDLDRKVVTRSEVVSDLKLSLAGKEAPLKQTATNRLISISDAK